MIDRWRTIGRGEHRPRVSTIAGARVLALALALALGGGSRALAQSTATLSGRVTDSSGAMIQGATVTALHDATALQRQTVTNSEGLFVLPLLPPGTYALTTISAGFAPHELKAVSLNVGDQIALTITLKVATVGESVVVSAESSRVQTSPSVGTVVDRQFIGNMPLNGRSFQSLILLTPGVTVTATGSSELGQFSVNGQRASANYFTVDGVSGNVGVGVFNGGGVTGSLAGSYPALNAFGGTNNLVSVDALEEYRIQTSTYAAEFGRQPGGQISLVTRSGTNSFHGTLFEYFRNDALDARDWFNPPPAPKPALRQNQFGGTFGGPLFRNETFFFFSYEGQRLRLPLSGTTYVPSLRLRALAADAVKPLLAAFPTPTGPETLTAAGLPSGFAPADFGVSTPGRLDATSIRIDHTTSRTLTLFGRFNESPSTFTTFSGGTFGIPETSTTAVNASTRTVTLGATAAITPRLTSELRVNYSRQVGRQEFLPATYGGAVPPPASLLTGGYDGLGIVKFNFAGFSPGMQMGDLTRNYQQQINLVENVSLLWGRHQLKFGIDYRRLSPTYYPQDQQQIDFRGEAGVMGSAADFIFMSHTDSARPRYTNVSAYGQDTWRPTPRLTLDLGGRWDVNPAPTEADGKMPAVIIGVTDDPLDLSAATLAPPGSPFYKTFYGAFAPRAGLAYQLSATPGRETVLRGGVGVYYDLGSAGAANGYPLRAQQSVTASLPFPLSPEITARPTIVIPTALPTTAQVSSNAEHLRLPYTLQWNVAVERAFGSSQSLSLSYVGAAARNLLTTQLMNRPAGGTTGPRPNPNFGSIFYTWNGPSSDYDSLQAQYRVHLRRGLQALVNYTWAHAIDEVSTDVGSNVLMRGNADFDVRHNLSAALTWTLPSPRVAPFLNTILANWSVDAIVHAQTGLPINITSGTTVVDGANMSLRPDVVPGQPFYLDDPTVAGGRRFNAAAFTTPPFDPSYPTTLRRQGNLGRNVLRTLPLYQADLALGRRFALPNGLAVQFKGELFNIFNHPMFGNYGTNVTSPATFGVPTTMLRSGLSNSGAGTGLGPLYQIGGPRSVQLSLRLMF